MNTMSGLRIAFGHVMHRRLRPAAHAFRYPVFSLHLRLQDLDALPPGGGCLFARDRFALLAFHAVDHGLRDGSPLLPWIRGQLARAGVVADGDIWLQTFPRVLGYVFNPVSFWYCHDRDGGLRAVLAEVNNTFGERHNYLLVPPGGGTIDATTTLEARKVFHVSPFMAVHGAYRFRFRTLPCEVHSARIDLADERGDLLHAVIAGRPQPLTRAALLRAFFAYPLQSFGVIVRIHWQALQLWWKRVPFHAKPEPPLEETTR